MSACFVGVVTALALSATLMVSPNVVAEESGHAPSGDVASGEAGRHFRRGVDLYGEANYAAALVEFRRAFALAPSATALYNVGEAQFQLQDYAGALKTFRRFLAEFGPTESRRAEVAQAVEVLRSRVGHLSVVTLPPGADVAVDDEAVGKTPFEPLVVSLGRRKVVASMPGRESVTEYVDVAAEDHVSVSLQLRERAADTGAAARTASTEVVRAHGGSGAAIRTASWVAASALAAGAITFGGLAIGESHSLAHERNEFPATGVVLNHDANLTATYSILADSFAAAAIVVGGATLYWTLSPGADRTTAPSAQARVTIAPASARFEMTF